MGWFMRRVGAIVFAIAIGGWGGTALVGQAAEPDPLLRIVHASSDAPAIDVYVSGQKVTTAPQFAAVTPYTTVPAGASSVQVIAAGAGPGGQTFLATNLDLRAGEAYTVVAADRVGQMAPVILTDTRDQAADGQAHVRLVHVSPDAPAVADVAVVGGPVIARNLPFKGATGYLTVAPGTYAFELRPAGAALTLATTPALVLEADRSYSAFVMGQLGDNTFRAVIAADNAATGGISGVPSTGGGGLSQTRNGSSSPIFARFGVLAAAIIYGLVLRCTIARKRETCTSFPGSRYAVSSVEQDD